MGLRKSGSPFTEAKLIVVSEPRAARLLSMPTELNQMNSLKQCNGAPVKEEKEDKVLASDVA